MALGGNAMTGPDGSASPRAQRDAIAVAMEPVAGLVAAGHEVVVTHGNGPQVGNLLVKNALAAHVVPPVPLDWCGAQTQGTIGFIILNTLERALADRGLTHPVAALVTRTRVDPHDPGFDRPTKPVGRYLPRDQAQALIDHGERWEDRGAQGWRRVVASPEPLEVLETPTVLTLLAAGHAPDDVAPFRNPAGLDLGAIDGGIESHTNLDELDDSHPSPTAYEGEAAAAAPAAPAPASDPISGMEVEVVPGAISS